MKVTMTFVLSILSLLVHSFGYAQSSKTEKIVWEDIVPDKTSPAQSIELTIPSNGSLISGFLYKANGNNPHPTLIMLHGLPGNEKSLDIAQVVRNHGWNVIFFNYRGSWGSQGEFSFKNCVEDATNVLMYAKKNYSLLQIDTSNIALFGHSMGGLVCLKVLQQLPNLKKGIAVSAMSVPAILSGSDGRTLSSRAIDIEKLFVLNIKSGKDFYDPFITDSIYFDLAKDTKAFSNKQLVILDENSKNKLLAEAIRLQNPSLGYEVWQTDHPFTNKRVALIKKVILLLDK